MLELVNIVYDCMLIVLVYLIGDLLCIENGELKVLLLYVVLEIYEVDYLSCMIYCINGLDGKFFEGDQDLFFYKGKVDKEVIYLVLVYIYEDIYNGVLVRVVVLFQLVVINDLCGVVLVQVVEMMENCSVLVCKIFWEMLICQVVLLVVIVLVILYVVWCVLQLVDVLWWQFDEWLVDDFLFVVLLMVLCEL